MGLYSSVLHFHVISSSISLPKTNAAGQETRYWNISRFIFKGNTLQMIISFFLQALGTT